MVVTREKLVEFLNSLQWQRMTKEMLQAKLQELLCTSNKLESSTDKEFKEVDYSYVFTNGVGACAHDFIDLEIYYLRMREKGWILITGSEILMYQE